MHEIATQLCIHDIMFAIDNFDTGYLHLAQIKEFPFAELKLDCSLVTKCGEDANDTSQCQALIDLAHRFGTTADAEGVETTSELKALGRMAGIIIAKRG